MVVNVTAAGGFHVEKSSAPEIQANTVQNQTSALTTSSDDDNVITIGPTETMGRLAKPIVVAKCSVSNGFCTRDTQRILDKLEADLTHSMRTMRNPKGDYVKPDPHSEMIGCLTKSPEKALCLVSNGSHAGEPLSTVDKAESEGVRALVGLLPSNFGLSLSERWDCGVRCLGWRQRWLG